ncbi:methyltransferase domain-containing protein [Prevotella sp. OH937_COT-195]|nr:methyltransferase domain-containing protein [Prevotella sp. OH937_COT-195]
MKVGTDGILLGAWAAGGRHILDVGTGTGLIALMMAQRFPNASVMAIDIDPDAALQAEENVSLSPFAERVVVKCSSLQQFDGKECYDSIVCNPPYFTQSLISPDAKRTLARHSVALPFDDLFCNARCLLLKNGLFSIIIPADALSKVETSAVLSGFFLVRKCSICTTPNKSPRRLLMTFSLSPASLNEEHGIIFSAPSVYSEWYVNITRDFLIKF